MSALQNIRKGLSSTGSSIIVAVLIFGLVATFGGFLTDPSARMGRNPATGETIQIAASKGVGFKAGKSLKDSL